MTTWNQRTPEIPSTYSERAAAEREITTASGGRYAGELRKEASVPRLPESSPWASDPVGVEPALGYSIQDQEPVGEAFEIALSLGEVVAPVADNPPAVVETASPNPALARLAEILPRLGVPQSFRRRI
jgi:hypothetical protein